MRPGTALNSPHQGLAVGLRMVDGTFGTVLRGVLERVRACVGVVGAVCSR
jgi:hypothetical protein